MHINWLSNVCFLLILSFLRVAAINNVEQFDEELTLRPLSDGKLATRFSFTTLLRDATPRNPETLFDDDDCTFNICSYIPTWYLTKTVTAQHYTLFPLALGQILREYAVTELHLTLNAGNWNYDRWGYPDEHGVGTGAELWAWMGDSSRTT